MLQDHLVADYQQTLVCQALHAPSTLKLSDLDFFLFSDKDLGYAIHDIVSYSYSYSQTQLYSQSVSSWTLNSLQTDCSASDLSYYAAELITH